MSKGLLHPTVWLILHEMPDGSKTSMEISYEEACRLDRKGFAALYRRHVYGAKKKEANQWADRQIAMRASGRFSG